MHEYSILSRSDNGLHKLLNGAGGGGGEGSRETDLVTPIIG